MARTEKKTKIKGLPPRVFLNERDAATGSYPYVPHNGLVNQNLRWLPFSDQNTLNFTQSNMYYGLGVPTASNYIPRLTFITTSLTGTGSVHAGIVDTYFNNQRYDTITQSYVPFKEVELLEVDGKSITSSFYSTGSNIENLRSPLWSKNKIEIPINVASESTVKIRRDVNYDSYQMGYFNFASGVWEGIGVGYDAKLFNEQVNSPELRALLTHSLVGFSTTMLPPRDSIWHIKGAGQVIQTFGFPYATKYHATSSQTISMKNFIDRPFLLEKFALVLSATFTGSAPTMSETMKRDTGESFTNLIPLATNTFFILNQRSRQNFQKPSFGDISTTFVQTNCPTSSQISKNGPAVFVDTVRDILGFANVVSFGSSLGTYSASYNTTGQGNESFPSRSFFTDLTETELHINSNVSGTVGVFWGPQKIMVSGTATVPHETLNFFHNFGLYFSNVATKTLACARLGNIAQDYFNGSVKTREFRAGGRNGFGSEFLDNRSYFQTPEVAVIEGTISPADSLVYRFDQYRKASPYLIFPEDRLVVGCQLPLAYPAFVGAVSSSNVLSLTFHRGEAKLILYGTYLSENKETNDTLNQTLTSNSVHEAIE